MKRLLSLLICFCFLQIGNCQIKHQFGVGLDAAGLLNRPSSWKGYKMKHYVYPYPSLHYSYKEKFKASIGFQAYTNNLTTDVKYDYYQPYFDTLMKLRHINNLDIVLGTDILSHIKKDNKFLKKSSLIIQAGTRVVFKGSVFLYVKKSDFPDIHFFDFKQDYGFTAARTLVRFTGHINYSFQLYKGLYANANLNYGYLFERDNPLIGQLGLRYWF